MKKTFFFFILLAISLNGYCQSKIYIEKADCFLEDCEVFADYSNIEFGYLYVPEDYNNPNEKYIKVAFSIVKSVVDNPEPDPILVFGGGWGYPEVFQTMGYLKTIPVKNRDIILYDYRGSGYSTPNLCPELGKKHWDLIRQDLNHDEFTQKLNTQFYTCFDELEQQDIDYRLYGTEIKTIDAVKLIEQLGYEEVNLFGISNGTMGIQGFIRATKNSTVKIRSIFSDSNVPMNEYLQGDFSLLYKKVLDQILDDCANNPDCERTYPNLKERFYNFLKESLNKPITYYGETVVIFNTYEINSVIHLLLYSSSNYKDLPLILEALIEGDLDFIAPLLDRSQNLTEGASGTSIINFTYDWKAQQGEIVKSYERIQKDYPEFMFADFWLDFYTTDTTITYNPRDTIPVMSIAPALVVAGTYDPITSLEANRIMHKRYTNSFYFELPKEGHGVFFTSCGKELLKAFINQPEKRPNDDCVMALESTSIPFTTNLYENTKVNRLIQEIGIKRNPSWIVTLLVPLLFCLLLFIRVIVQTIRKKGFNTLQFIQSLCILLFQIGLAYYSFETVKLVGRA